MKRRLLAAVVPCILVLAACGGSSTHPVRPANPANVRGGRSHSAQFVQQAEHAHLPSFGPGLSATNAVPGYDAVTLSNVPSNAQAVGCYMSGSYVNCAEARSRFPHAHIVSIATNASALPATCLDTEPGDSTPDQVASWIRRDHAAGVARPCDYANASEMVTVQADLRASGLARSDYLLWVAAWNNDPSIPAGFDAHQWFSDFAIDKDTFSSAFFGPPKPTGPVCFGKHWQHTALCNRVRSQDAALGRKVKLENGYIAVSQRNVAKFQGRLTVERRNLSAIGASLRILRGIGQKDPLLGRLWQRYSSEVKLTQHSLANAQGHLAVEQRKHDAAQTALTASLKKYGFGA